MTTPAAVRTIPSRTSRATITRALVLLALGTLVLGGCNRGSAARATTFELHDAWVRAAPDSGSTTAAYIRFVNGSPDTVVVSHFESDDARLVELHRSSVDSSGAAHMAMQDALVIAPNHNLVMKPGGYHLMLIGTTRSLPAGKLVRIVMYLSNGSIVSTSARVRL
jgi:periplasmic copper chaperone A